MAKDKAEKKEQIKEVIGITKAEELQKEDNGWELESIVKVKPTKEGLTVKKYKFRKEEK